MRNVSLTGRLIVMFYEMVVQVLFWVLLPQTRVVLPQSCGKNTKAFGQLPSKRDRPQTFWALPRGSGGVPPKLRDAPPKTGDEPQELRDAPPELGD